MANTYIITSVTHLGDAAIVTGTVNGTPVTAQFSFSSLGTFATALLAQSFLAGLMLQAFNALQPPTVVSAYNGTIVQ